MFAKSIISICMVFGFISSVQAAGNAKKGKARAATCFACHGAKGISVSPVWPNLAGQKQAYLVKQLKAFKSGARKDPSMKPMVAGLSVQDMEDIAAYFSSLK
ncbi:MAG: cytochrome c [Bdellovibrionaceae bacterium]|nr:cytochrome c [Pseudobdellovibrionaceae bacterium]